MQDGLRVRILFKSFKAKRALITVIFLLFVSLFLFLVYSNFIQRGSPPLNSHQVNPDIEVKTLQLEKGLSDLLFVPQKDVFYIANSEESKIGVVGVENFSKEGEVVLRRADQSVISPNKIVLSDRFPVMFVSSFGNRYSQQGLVAKVSINTFLVENEVSVGKHPSAIAIDPWGRYLLVVSEFSNTVSVIELGEFQVINTIKVGVKPVDIVVDQSGEFAYVANENGGSLSVISMSNLTLVDTITGLGQPSSLLAYPRQDLILVLDKLNHQLAVLDQRTNKIIKRIDVVGSPVDMVLDPIKKKLYVVSFTENSIGIVDLSQEKMTKAIKLGSSFEQVEGLTKIILDPDWNTLVLSNTKTGQVYLVKIE